MTSGFVGTLGVFFLRNIPPLNVVPQIELEIETQSPLKRRQKIIVMRETFFLEPYKKVLKSVDFWMVFYSITIVSGSAFILINNLGALVISLGGQLGDQDKFVKLFGVSNGIGRVAGGVFSDFLSFKRVWYFVICSFIMCLAQMVLAYSTTSSLFFTVPIVGIFYGIITSIAPLYIGERFGGEFFGGNWAMLSSAPGLGSLLFSSILTGLLYDKSQGELEDNCNGQKCFQTAFLVMSILCILSTALVSITAKRFSSISSNQL